MGEKDCQPDADQPRGSGISRRKFVAGGLVLVGGTSNLLDTGTDAQFSDLVSSSNNVQIGALNRVINDRSNSDLNSVEYQISWNVQIETGFDRTEITILNKSNGDGTTWVRGKEGSDTWTYDHGVGQHEYEFTFEAYVDGEGGSQLAFEEVVTDVPNGSSPDSNDDLSSPESPEFDWILVDDVSHSDDGAQYDLYYEIVKPDRFARMDAMFDNEDNGSASTTHESTAATTGKIEYRPGYGYNAPYEITAVVYEDTDSGPIQVDEQTFDDTADGGDRFVYGDPERPDSPQLESFTVTNESRQDQGTRFVLDYEISNIDRFEYVDVTFKYGGGKWATDRTTNGAAPTGTVTYPVSESKDYRDGANPGDFEIIVEVYEMRDGTVIPIDSGALESPPNRGGSRKWPEDAS